MEQRRLTVVQVLPALNAGGVERTTLEIGSALTLAGHRSIVVSAGGRLVEKLQSDWSEHITLDIGRKSLSTLRHVWTLRQLFRQWQPDILHARSRLPAWLAHFALASMPAPRPHFVTTVHGLHSPGAYSAIMPRGERVICVSNSVRDHARRPYRHVAPARLTGSPRGIEPDAWPVGYRGGEAGSEPFDTELPRLRGGVPRALR